MIFHFLDLFLLVNYQLLWRHCIHLAFYQFILNVFRLIFVQHFLYWCLLDLGLVVLGRWALLFGFRFCLMCGRRAVLLMSRPWFHFYMFEVFHEFDRFSSRSLFAVGAWVIATKMLRDWSLVLAWVGERFLVYLKVGGVLVEHDRLFEFIMFIDISEVFQLHVILQRAHLWLRSDRLR